MMRIQTYSSPPDGGVAELDGGKMDETHMRLLGHMLP
jgi:hypothetical protein